VCKTRKRKATHFRAGMLCGGVWVCKTRKRKATHSRAVKSRTLTL
jgi:hypothetical protein